MFNPDQIIRELINFTTVPITLEDIKDPSKNTIPFHTPEQIPSGYRGNINQLKGLDDKTLHHILEEIDRLFVMNDGSNDILILEGTKSSVLMEQLSLSLSDMVKLHYHFQQDKTFLMSKEAWDILACMHHVIKRGRIKIDNGSAFPTESEGNSRMTEHSIKETIRNTKTLSTHKDSFTPDHVINCSSINPDDVILIMTKMNIIIKSGEYWYNRESLKCEQDLTLLLSKTTTPIQPKNINAPFTLDKSQTDAIFNICMSPDLCVILCGGAGCGKTTVVNYIMQQYNCSKLGLCPTGKGTGPLVQSTGFDCYTISKMYFDLKGKGKKAQQTLFKFKNCALVIDESSMINTCFMRQLIFIINTLNPCKVIFMGDDAQLEPIGVGDYFSDMIGDK